MAGFIDFVRRWFGRGGVPAPVQAASGWFQVGQVWRYKTRPSEDESRVVIGRIEQVGNTTVIHIGVVNLRIRNPRAPMGFSTILHHAPLTEAALKESVTELATEHAELASFDEGYQQWLAGFKSGQAGVFSIPVAEIVAGMEEAIGGSR